MFPPCDRGLLITIYQTRRGCPSQYSISVFSDTLYGLTIHKGSHHELQRLKYYPIGDAFGHHVALILSEGVYALVDQNINECIPAGKMDVLDYTSFLGKPVHIEFNMYSNRRGGAIEYEARKIIRLHVRRVDINWGTQTLTCCLYA